jgi:hypothetical protein
MANKHSEIKIMIRCFCCGQDFQFGPHIYAGKHINKYNISVCSSCYGSNWDGWGPTCESKLLAHLKDKELPIPRRNEKGWLPRDG